jgi:hypothetical protein
MCLVEERKSDLKEDASDLSPLEVAAKDTRECERERYRHNNGPLPLTNSWSNPTLDGLTSLVFIPPG